MNIDRTMRERLMTGWDLSRVLRAVFAIIFLIAAVTRHEPVAWFAAAFFGVQAIFNIGCCGMAACQPVRKHASAPLLEEPVTYEEVK